MIRQMRGHLIFWGVIVSTLVCVTVVALIWQRPAPLTPTEARCVGSWTYLSPDHAAKTRIVYRFGADRSVCEEHYYLTSAWPDVPRITMRGQWGVDASGRMTVEPSGGAAYLRDSLSGWLNEYLDDGRQAWPRPVLRRIYGVKSASTQGIQFEANRSGGGRTRITMTPFSGSPDNAAIR